jgi:hypothetical protein
MAVQYGARDELEPVTERLRRGRDEVRQVRADVSGIIDDLRTLAQKETELARAELQEQFGISRSAIIWSAVAGVGAMLTLVFMSLGLMFALDEVMPAWAAALVTAAVLGALVTLAGMLAMARFRRISFVPTRTINSVNEDVRWSRNQLKFNAK